MNPEYIAVEINDILSDEDQISMDFKDSRTTHTTLEKDGEYFYVLTIGDDGFDRHKLSDEASEVLLSAYNEIGSWVASDLEHSVSEPKIHLFNDRNEKMFVSISLTFERQNTEIFDQYASSFEKDDGTHNVATKDIEQIEIRDSFTKQGITDATCYYRTLKPHELYANIDTIEEYADMLSQNSGMSKEDILDMTEFTVHYHPQNRDTIQTIVDNIMSEYRKNISYPDFAELSLEETKIKPESAELTVGVYISVKELVNQS